MRQPKKNIWTITVCLALALCTTVVAVAWFAGIENLGVINFSPEPEAVSPDLTVWTYNTANEEGTDGWTSSSSAGSTQMPAIVKTPVEGTTMYNYSLSSLHFGKVDNLVTIREDNKLLLRLYFDRSTLYSNDGVLHTFKLSFSYASEGYTYTEGTSVLDSFHLYEEQLNEAKESIGSTEVSLYNAVDNGGHVLEYREDNPAAMQFLQLRYAVSTDAYDPAGEGFVDGDSKPVELSASLPINCGSAGAKQAGKTTPICQNCVDGKCGAVDLTAAVRGILTDSTIPDKGGFYLYIELTPLLDAFGMQENILDYFVPAYMFFDVKLGVEIG